MIKYENPNNDDLLKSRNKLLQNSLRPDMLPYTIDKEYPIVLSPKHSRFSICAIKNNNLVAHANLWPRELISSTTKERINIGLIGNVATSKKFRGQGIMTTLFREIEKRAYSQNLDALILWSDLLDFYKNLGFNNFSKEQHFYFSKDSFLPTKDTFHQLTLIKIENTSDNEIGEILKLRYKTPKTLNRSINEFKLLLTIPDTFAFKIIDNGQTIGYFIVGKGYDMAGVIHEWGANDPQYLITAIKKLIKVTGFEQCILLTPEFLEDNWQEYFENNSLKFENNSMALLKLLNKKRDLNDLSSCFIWGLDSI